MPVKKNISEQGSLIGRRVYLRPFSKNDLSHVQKWSNDPEIRRLTGEVTPMSRAEAEKWYKQLRADKNRIWFVIVLKRGNRVIGEAGHLLLDYAFERLGFHRISIGVVGFNERALRFWEGLGFKKEGVHRDGYYCDNEYSDFVMMSILEDEFKTLYKGKRARALFMRAR